MKNIHVIPTDKPSRLFYSKEFEFFKIANKYDVWREGRNIYITSDEEIKEGVDQWYLDKFLNNQGVPVVLNMGKIKIL